MPFLALLVGCPPEGRKPVDSVPDVAESTPPMETGTDSGPPDDSPAPPLGDPGTVGPGSGCLVQTTWNVDADGDGFGGSSLTVCGWEPPPNATEDTSDCDDTRATVYPGAPPLYTSGRSEDCGETWGVTTIDQVPTSLYADPDMDGSLGEAVATFDATGDGLPDLVLADSYGTDRGGSIYVIPGPISRGLELEDPAAAAFATLHGVHDNYEYLDHVSPAGDVDGDGYEDLLAGGYQRNSLPGVVYLLLGPVGKGDVWLDDMAIRFDGLYEGSQVAPAVGLGDADGDGRDEVAIADVYADDQEAGEVYLLEAAAAADSLEDAETVIRGSAGDTYLGSVVANMGDVTGDGVEDLSLSGGTQGAFLLTQRPRGTVFVSDVALRVVRDASGAWTRGAPVVNVVADVDDDGYRDAGFGWSGMASLHILHGPLPETGQVDLATQSDTTLWSTNHGLDSALGYAASLGDWDDDGHPDLLVANDYYAPDDHVKNCDGFDNHDCYLGAAFLLAGPITAPSVDLEVEADRLENDTPWTHGYGIGFGHAMAGGEDLDQDGFPDVAIGYDWYGQIWVLFGGGRV